MTNPIFSNTAGTDKAVLRRYLDLPQPDDKIMATYIWIDGSEEHLRGEIFSFVNYDRDHWSILLLAKTRTLNGKPKSPADLPWWNFDGSSTAQAEGSNSDVYLKPVAIFRDPFMLGDNILVMCETYKYNKEATGRFISLKKWLVSS